MSPALRGSQIGRSTGRRRINLRVLAALGTADPEQLADATLNALGEPLPADQVCRVCGYRLDPWLVQRGHTTHLEDPL